MAHHHDDFNFRSTVLRDIRLEHQFERRQHDFKANMDVAEGAPQYRVDGVITGAYVPPDEDNCIEMQCFSLPSWQALLGKVRCCGDYQTIWMQCIPGTAEYSNADLQDSDTGVSGCVDPDMTFGDTEFDNAEMTMDMMSTEPNPCP